MGASLNRRQLGVAAAGAGMAALAVPATAQIDRAMPKSTAEFGAAHRRAVDELVFKIGGGDLTKQQGLESMVKRLSSAGEQILKGDEVDMLLKVIQALFKETLEAVIKLVQEQLRQLQDKGERLVKALLSILLDSLEWARERIKDPKTQPWVDIAGADLAGALTGAIGGIPGGLPGILSGALFGAIAGSALAGAKILIR